MATQLASQDLPSASLKENLMSYGALNEWLFKFQDIWGLVENRYADLNEENRLKESRKDSEALFFIQQAVHKTVFSRIVTA